MTRRALTDAQVTEARRLKANGWSYARIGERFSVDYQTIKRAVNPEYQARRNQQAREAHRSRRVEGGKPAASKRDHGTKVEVQIDAMARLAEIPRDTRTLTQRIFGDPIPGDRRREIILNGARS